MDDIKNLRNSAGLGIQAHGSSNLLQALLKHGLVEELWLKIFPSRQTSR
jgi:hypothetical protein